MSGPSGELNKRIARTVLERKLFKAGDTIIVALSGGADSTALLDLLSKLPDIHLSLVAAHLNHSLRGPDSDADEEFSRSLALRYAIPFESRRIDVKAFAARHGLNLEDAGRRSRIAFFCEMREKWRATAVALAHHAGDQAETVLMRLLRGSGPHGLSGMPFRNGRGFVRPMLEITRQEIEAYLAKNGLAWREDASNRDTAFLRNRIRHELLPLLERYNPAIRERLTETAALLSDENELLGQMAEKAATQACTVNNEGLACDISLLAAEPPAIRRRVFRLALQRLAGNLNHFTNRHIEALELLSVSPSPNATLNLPQGVTAVREYASLLLRRTTAAPLSASGEVLIEEPGHYPLPGGGLLTVTFEPSLPDFAALPSNTTCFDLDKVPFPWLVRTFRPGDRIVPLGMNGGKKVKEIFIDSKIPLPQRQQIPLIFSGDTLIWVCGLRSSELAKVDSSSSRFIRAVFSAP